MLVNMIPFAVLEWLPGNELWWIIAAGAIATTAAFLLCLRFFSSTPRISAKQMPPDEGHDPFAMGGTTERRGAFRRKGSSIGVRFTLIDQEDATHEGWVLDRSMGGLGLFSESVMQPGTMLRVLPLNAPPMTPWSEVEVKTCHPHETGYHLGCAFVKSPPYAILLLFG